MKRRIFFGLAPLFILLIAMGLYAVTLFTNLGNRVDVILRENFRSVLAGQQMKETAERMDSALFFSLVGEEERGRKLYAQNLPGFRENLRIELDNITLPGEAELAAKVKQLHERYAARAEAFWATPDIEARRKMYFGEMLPVFTEIKDTAQEIIRINQDNMVQADREARRLAREIDALHDLRNRRRHWRRDLFCPAAPALDFASDPSAHDRLKGTWRG